MEDEDNEDGKVAIGIRKQHHHIDFLVPCCELSFRNSSCHNGLALTEFDSFIDRCKTDKSSGKFMVHWIVDDAQKKEGNKKYSQ